MQKKLFRICFEKRVSSEVEIEAANISEARKLFEAGEFSQEQDTDCHIEKIISVTEVKE